MKAGKEILNYTLMVLTCLVDDTGFYRNKSIKEIKQSANVIYGINLSEKTIRYCLNEIRRYGLLSDQDDNTKLSVEKSINENNEFSQFTENSMARKIMTINEAISVGKEIVFKPKGNNESSTEPYSQIHKASVYSVYEKNNNLYILYSEKDADKNDVLKTEKLENIHDIAIVKESEIIPFYTIQGYELITDTFLQKNSRTNITKMLQKKIIVQFKAVVQERNITMLEKLFGKERVRFYEEDGKKYAEIKDIYGDAAEIMFQNPLYGTVVYPVTVLKRFKIRAEILQQAYFNDEWITTNKVIKETVEEAWNKSADKV